MVAHDPKWCFFLGNKNDLVVIESVYYGILYYKIYGKPIVEW